MPVLPADLKPYPAYKPSGVEWLGDVPAHWEVRRLKTHVNNINEQTSDPREGDICLALEHVESWTGQYREAGPEESFTSRVKRFRPDDVLFCKLRPYLAKVTRPNRAGVCVGEFLVLRPSEATLTPYYLEHLLRSKPLIDTVDGSTFGAKMPRADWRFIGSLPIPVPPLAEQAAIAGYLDQMDGRIRRYTQAKQKLIGLLDEYRQAVIHHAVTRGLDPQVRLKPSGVEWLGEVPAHWEVLALKRLGWFRSGAGFPLEEQGQHNQDLPFFKVSDMNLPGNETVMRRWNNAVSASTAKRLGATVFPAGSIVFPKVGGALLTNKRRIVDRPACIDNNLLGYVVQRGNRAFLFRLLTQIDLGRIAKPGPVPAVNEGEVREIRVALPPESEQAAIAGYLDKATGAIDKALAATRRQVALLGEYRARLIADVVTGQCDVRGVAVED